MTKFMTGLLALAWLIAVPFAAQAQTAYTPAKFKAAIEQGQTVLLHYKSTW